MTKTITKTTLAILAMGMAAPAMAATDGTPGATSSGTFDVTLQVNPPVAETVNIFGLSDLPIPAITRVAGQATAGQSYGLDFCLTRSGVNTGSNHPINVTITQQNGSTAGGDYSLNSGTKTLPVLLTLAASNQQFGNQHGVQGSTFSVFSVSSCSPTSNERSSFTITILPIPADSTASDGSLSQTFTLVASLP